MNSSNYDHEMEPVKRSSFLTALCILTFIGSGWAILSSAWAYTTANKVSSVFSDIKKNDSLQSKDSVFIKDSVAFHQNANENRFEVKMKASIKSMLSPDKIKNKAMGDFIAALFTLSGAILMWNLKRTGFYLYIVGVIIGIAAPLIIFQGNFLAVGIAAFGSFFGLIFIALYALNFKSLK